MPHKHFPQELRSLSNDEDEIVARLLVNRAALSAAGDVKEHKPSLHNFITDEADVVTLLKLSELHPEIETLCKQPEFDDYWNSLLKKAGKNPQDATHDETHPTHEFLPLPTIHSFDLVKGLFAYGRYRNLIRHGNSDSTRTNSYSFYAMELGNFNAINAFCNQKLNVLNSIEDKSETIAAILVVAQKTAALYWTPGYILLANMYIALSNFEVGSSNRTAILKLALEAMVIAEKLELYSSEMINNAYHGKSIVAATRFQFKDWNTGKAHITALAKGSITITEMNTIYGTANAIVDQIIRRYFPEKQALATNDSLPSTKMKLA